MRASNTIVLASNNHHKLLEFRELLKNFSQSEIKLEPAEKYLRNSHKLSFVEKGSTYLENSQEKARTANLGCHYPSLGDDSGLEVLALGGRPGVKSHRYAIVKAGQTQDAANVDKLLEELKGYPMDKRGAKFVCSLSLVIEGIVINATGEVEGTIAEAPQGENGFGYDPIFIPKGFNRSFAEMSEDEKNELSHRSVALKNLLQQIQSHGIIFARP